MHDKCLQSMSNLQLVEGSPLPKEDSLLPTATIVQILKGCVDQHITFNHPDRSVRAAYWAQVSHAENVAAVPHYNGGAVSEFPSYHDLAMAADQEITTIRQKLDDLCRDMRKAFTADITSLEHIAVRLRQRRNEGICINRLPPEITCRILLEADNGRLRSKLRLSQICTALRGVALNFGSLWATLDLQSVRHADRVPELFARARAYDLHLNYVYLWSSSFRPVIWDTIGDHISSVRTLTIKFPYNLPEKSRRWLLEGPAPSLETLHMSVESGIMILPQLLGGQSRGLKRMSLKEICFHPNKEGFNLSHLSLTISKPGVGDPKPEDCARACVALLSQCQRLRELDLKFPSTIFVAHPPLFTAVLPQLEILRLDLPFEDAAYFLESVVHGATIRCLQVETPFCQTLVLPEISHHLQDMFSSIQYIIAYTRRLIFGYADLQGKDELLALRGSGTSGTLGWIGRHRATSLLRRFRLHLYESTSSEVADSLPLLRASPSLTELDLICDFGKADAAVIAPLALEYLQNSSFCPLLHTLALGRLIMREADLSMIKQIALHSCLRCLHFYCCKFKGAYQPAIDKIRESGVEVKLFDQEQDFWAWHLGMAL